jgi:hypothetical protein
VFDVTVHIGGITYPTNPNDETYNIGSAQLTVSTSKMLFTPSVCNSAVTVTATPTISPNPTNAFITTDSTNDPIATNVVSSAYADQGVYTVTIA